MKPRRNTRVVYVVIYVIAVRNNDFAAIVIGTAAIRFVIPHEIDGYDSIATANTSEVAASALVHRNRITICIRIAVRDASIGCGWRVTIEISI